MKTILWTTVKGLIEQLTVEPRPKMQQLEPSWQWSECCPAIKEMIKNKTNSLLINK